jgi:hypothetical protein
MTAVLATERAETDGELCEEALETVVGGLERAWDGTWQPSELGLAPNPAEAVAPPAR